MPDHCAHSGVRDAGCAALGRRQVAQRGAQPRQLNQPAVTNPRAVRHAELAQPGAIGGHQFQTQVYKRRSGFVVVSFLPKKPRCLVEHSLAHSD